MVATGASASDPRARLQQLRHDVDALANRYFAAQQQSHLIDQEVAQLRLQLQAASAQQRATRAAALTAAVALYSAQPPQFVETPESVLEAARVDVLLQGVIARDNDRIERYVHATRQLLDAQQSIAQRSADQRKLIAELERQTQALNQQLGDAQRAYQDLVRAEAAARAATTSSSPGSQPAPTKSSSSVPTQTTSTGSQGPSSTTTGHSGGTTGGPGTVPAPRPPSGSSPHRNDGFLACVRQRESHGIYTAVNPGGYYGAYQFGPQTWNITASHAGRPDLIGVRPDHASPYDQDEIAWVLYQWQGKAPWGGHCP